MPQSGDIVATVHADLTDLLRGSPRSVKACAAWNGDIYVIVDRNSHEPPADSSRPYFPPAVHDSPVMYEILRVSPTGVRSALVTDSTVFHHAQPLPEGFLLVGARCWWTPDGPDKNAVVCDHVGRVLRRFTLGDGIQDVRTTADGTIWVSYFDEGVFGNYGWGGPGPEPIGASGLVAFDPSGRELFHYDPSAAGTGMISDLYALNVADREVWAYFYTEFPLVRIRDGAYTTWSLGLAGAGALAVRFPHVLLYGGYERRDRVCLVALDPSSTRCAVSEARLVDELGKPLGSMFAHGVEDRLYLFDGKVLRTVTSWDILT